MDNLKTILAMLGLVGIGFVGGFFTHRSMAKSHFEKVARIGTPGGFEERLLDEVLKVDSTQRKELEPIVRDFGRKMGQLHKDIREERAMLMDSLYRSIGPALDEDQQEALKGFAERQKRFRKRRPSRLKKRKERQ